MNIKFSKSIRRKKLRLILITIIITFATLIMEECTQQFIDSMAFSLTVFGGLAALYLLLAIFRYIKQYLVSNLTKSGSLEGQAQITKRVLSKDYAFYVRNESGNILYSLTEDMYQCMPWYTCGRLQMLLETVNLLCLYGFMLRIDIILSVAALILVVLSLWWADRFSDNMGAVKNIQQECNSKINQYIINVGRCRNTIKQLDKSDFFVKKYDDYLEKEYQPVIEKLVRSHAFFIVQLILSQEIIPFIMLFVGVVLTILGKSTIGRAIIIMDLTVKISGSIQTIAELMPQRKLAMGIEKRIETVLEDTTISNMGRLPVDGFAHMEIHIDGYRYMQEGKHILECTDIELEKGDICTIKGISGGGKSTLAKMIAGLQDMDNVGCIQYNGVDITEFSKEEYHRHVLYVSQDIVLFEGTLRDNLLMEQAATPEELEEVVESCCLQDFVGQYGLDYILEPEGRNVSGGERQRIGIARMLMRKPDILILDEVTSSLDTDTTEKVVGNIAAFAKKYGITIIAISHKKDFERYSSKIVTIG
ncbi:MAG: ABC transporter ATP-binding protein/permease [Lachnospiraceae bacterium]